tara:strand:+ start:1427 stop:2251 length:825 start_codon:yes stop_codon:yes gene_type:complete
MSLPYFPLYPTDFEAKTSHLTLAEDGAYNRLLRICWMTPGCTIPDDDTWIMRRLRVDRATFDEVVSVVISEFFDRSNGRLSNAKLTRIFIETNEAHQKRVLAGSKGGKAKSAKSNNKASSNAVAKPKQPEPEPEPEPDKELKRDTIVSPKKAPDQSFDLVPSEQIPKPAKNAKASRLPDDWALPRDWGDWAVSEGWDASDVRLEAEKFRDFWISKAGKDAAKLNWLATWRNWMRNSRTPKSTSINGGIYDQNTNKSDQRDRALADEILAAARAR